MGFYGDRMTLGDARKQIIEGTSPNVSDGERVVGNSIKKLSGYMNTFVYILVNGTTVYRLHQTDIIKVLKNGTVVLNTDGYMTVTTASRMREIFSLLHLSYRTWSERGVWKFKIVQGYPDGWQKGAVDFVDGMMVTKKGKVILPGPAVAMQKMRVRVQAKIRKYCDLLAKKLATGWMVPDAGDCMHCQMHTDEGRSLGDASRDVDHLIGHLKAGYLMGSLLWNAYKDAFGERDPNFRFAVDGNADSTGKFTSPPGKSGVQSAKKFVKKYLEKRLLKPGALKGMLAQGVQL